MVSVQLLPPGPPAEPPKRSVRMSRDAEGNATASSWIGNRSGGYAGGMEIAVVSIFLWCVIIAVSVTSGQN